MATEKPAKSGEVALAGKDGDRLNTLIDKSESTGADLLYRITKAALSRLLDLGLTAATVASGFYSPAELAELTHHLGAVIGTGDLMGRSRLREKMNKAEAAKGLHRFAEDAEKPWAFFPDTLPILPPESAVRYFTSLVPTIGVNPTRFGAAMQRAAFTLANVTERTILSNVQDVILRALVSGEDWNVTPHRIEQILADVGVHPTNPQYAQMVFRTNAMDAYNVGLQHELEENPEVKEFFPAWQYLGIRDGREGDDHRPKFNLYFPSSLSFHEVRGPRVFNCRCTPRHIDRYQWAYLQASGVRFSNILNFPVAA